MREVNLAGIDLNLLPALEALVRRASVTRAAADVGLSQPAMSRALSRLRALLGDPILVRVAGGLAPTARARALAPALAAALDALGGVVRPRAFEASALDRTFRIAAGDGQSVLIAPPLLAALGRSAPRARVVVEPVNAGVRGRVESGEIDMALALATTPLPPGVLSEPLAEDRLALVLRRGHPSGGGRVTLRAYARLRHVTVSVFGDRASDIDAELADAGLVREIAMTTPHFVTALAAVGASDCATTLSAALARRFAGPFGLELHEPPLRGVALPLVSVYSATRADDPGLRWFRARLSEAAAAVFATGGGRGAKPMTSSQA